MLDNLIDAYRNQIYDLNKKKLKNIYFVNKRLVWITAALVVIYIGSVVYFAFTNPMLSLLWLVVFFVISIAADRYAVKRYRQRILREQEHLKKVVRLLETAVPGINLNNKEQVEELIARLSQRIEAKAPFSRIKTALGKFCKYIILPVIAYIAGVFTSDISKIGFPVVAALSIILFIIFGLFYFIVIVLAELMAKITCRSHDASIALREDLLDIKLLFFTKRLASNMEEYPAAYSAIES